MMQEDTRFTDKIITDKVAKSITRVEELAYEMKVSEVMTSNPKVISSEMKMEDVLDMFRVARISGAPVLKGSKIIGVVSIQDLISSLRKSDLGAPATSYMTAKLISVKPSDPVIEALKLFVSTAVGRLVVVDEKGNLTGILTKGDITAGLLRGLQKEYQSEELKRYRASHLFEDIESDRTSLILRYEIKKGDFVRGGAASSNIKRALLRMGASPQISRRVGIAIYEAEMNLIIHTLRGGQIKVEIEPHQINMHAIDDGPGIEDIAQALKPGFSTATQEIRELGFGAGMGLVNINRCVDEMHLDSKIGIGTDLSMKIYLNEENTVGEGSPANKETA